MSATNPQPTPEPNPAEGWWKRWSNNQRAAAVGISVLVVVALIAIFTGGGEPQPEKTTVLTDGQESQPIEKANPRQEIWKEPIVLFAGTDLPSRAIREQIGSAIHVIIQQTRLHDGTRKVTYISEITGMEGGVVTMQDIFLFKQTGFDAKGKVVGHFEATGNVPRFVQLLKRRGIETDMSIYQRPAPEPKSDPKAKRRSGTWRSNSKGSRKRP